MKTNILLTALVIATIGCKTTVPLASDADKHFNNLEYHIAAQQYQEALKTKEDPQAELRLAECYYHMNHFTEAQKIFARATGFAEFTSNHKLQYAHVLKHNGNYNEARKWYVEYLLDNPKDIAVANELHSCDSLESYKRLMYQYTVKKEDFNAEGSDFSPAFYKDGIVFCSERSKADAKSLSKWTGHSYLDLYYTQRIQEVEPVAANGMGPSSEPASKQKSTFAEPGPFQMEINSAYNEGPLCFTKDGKTIYFTRNLLGKKNTLETGKQNVNNFEIYRSTLINDKWSDPQLLSFDNKNFSVGHPALSKDEKRLYFVSDRPGGFGGTDIYYSNLVDGEWSRPVNAGPTINTSENEMFPVVYVSETGNEILYFSSEGHPGMGGLDMYASLVNGNSFGTPVHLTAPLNSSADDFGIITSPDGITGYFSSNRDQEDGSDKIYSFKKYVPEFFMQVLVVRKDTKEPISSANVAFSNVKSKEKDEVSTDVNGKIFLKMPRNSQFDIKAQKDQFFAASGSANNMGKIFSDTIHVTIELDPIILDKPIVMDNIYYDYNKADIRQDAKPSLNRLASLMKENPSIHVELSSHTDCRGKDAYNMKLSQKRAESAVNYIISQGVDGERIYAKGYGESQLLNQCKNGVKCSEEEHAVNRRTEFKVVKIDAPAPIQP
jgi:outer membrane protein OmpA-like peptidoglycan-associated protein